MSKRKHLLILTITILLSNTVVIQIATTYSTENWKIEPNTIMEYLVDHEDDPLIETILDEFASLYNFTGLSTNLLGDPVLKLNITEINTSIPIDLMVNQFLNFSAPLQNSQKQKSGWIPRYDLYFPVCVPVDCWDEINSSFSQKVEVLMFEDKFLEEYRYDMYWIEQGQNFNITAHWSPEDGVLLGITYIVSSGENKDYLFLSYSGKTTPDSLLVRMDIDPEKLAFIIPIGVVIIALSFGLYNKKLKEKY
ncbi:hypothetical protein [Candidatus Lokiarchaeum ossiferum]|uniref:hypothetical protein n=1 Tax=Candidatus Lokiarchaeum ossiferum TaxID=2951803 RepID=UPI00352FB409